jgi:geranylgeranyl pyrophosphate synthase
MRSLPEALSFFQQRVYQKIPLLLPPITTPAVQLNRALHYVCQQPGKAIRPFLVYATGQLFETPYTALDSVAIAIEVIHLYSLVHDDLPSMDDDDLRRGRPTCHKAFSESTAILVGDGLQALAFQILSDTSDKIEETALSAELRLKLIEILAKAAGISGMVKGQAIDLENIDALLTEAELETMHLCKTGALIEACVHSAALIGLNNASSPINTLLSSLLQYAKLIGLAFQIQDDVLDATATTEQLGKKANKDSLKNKPNFVSLLGVEQAQKKADRCIEQALTCLEPFCPIQAELLIGLTHYIIKRES